MTVSHFSIDPDIVDALIDALTRLKRNEGSQDQKCKFTFMNMQACYENEMSLSAIRIALSKATRMRDALQALALDMEDEIQEMKCKIPVVGIRGLPNETLSRIFELACEELDSGGSTSWETNGTRAIRLSRVCTHFRSVALNTPRLWASVSYDMMKYDGKLETFLTRSKNAPLTIDIGGFCYPHDTLIRFLSAINLHAHRWIKLIVDTSRYLTTLAYAGSEPLDCPILESIDVRYDHEQIDAADDTLWLHWNMPALKHLTCKNWCPKPFPNSHLTSLEYVWRPGSDTETRNYVPGKLQVFIYATHSLRDFTLVISPRPMAATFFTPYLPAYFPQLVKFSLRFVSFPGEHLIADVMRTLHLPNLEELSVELYPINAQGLQMDRYIRALLPFHDKFPRIKNFRLSVEGKSGSRYPFDMATLFSLLPALHNLTLKLPKARPYLDDRDRGNANMHNGPALRSLRLIRCDSVTEEFLEDALPMIRGGIGEDAFSLLEITDCRNISRSRVEGMLRPKEKLLWS